MHWTCLVGKIKASDSALPWLISHGESLFNNVVPCIRRIDQVFYLALYKLNQYIIFYLTRNYNSIVLTKIHMSNFYPFQNLYNEMNPPQSFPQILEDLQTSFINKTDTLKINDTILILCTNANSLYKFVCVGQAIARLTVTDQCGWTVI